MMLESQQLIKEIIEERKIVTLDIFDQQKKIIGYLAPVTISILDNQEIIDKLTKWRNQTQDNFLSQFTVTSPETKRWLKDDVLTDYGRLMFILYFQDKPIGRMGFMNLRPPLVDGDGLIRGERGGGIHFIHYALIAELTWIFEILGVEKLITKILSKNENVIFMHEQFGFKRQQEVKIYFHDQGTKKIILEYGEKIQEIKNEKLIYMTLDKDNFLQKHSN